VPAHYDEPKSQICADGLGVGSDGYSGEVIIRAVPDGSLVVLGRRQNEITVARQRGEAWASDTFESEPVAEVGGATTSILRADMAVGSSGDILVGWTQEGHEAPIMKKFDGLTWQNLGEGAPGLVPHAARNVESESGGWLWAAVGAVAVDDVGRPLVAWAEESGTGEYIYVARLENGAWEEIAGPTTGGGIGVAGSAPSVAQLGLSPFGQVSVLWISWPEDRLYFSIFDGATWTDLAGSAGADGIGGYSNGWPQLAYSHDGYPTVSWERAELGVEWEYTVKRWTGEFWESIGFPDIPFGYNLRVSLTVDREDGPLLAWGLRSEGSDSASDTYVKRYASTRWTELNGSAAKGGVSNSVNPTIAVGVVATADRICVAWSEEEPEYDPIDPDDNAGYSKGGEPRLLVRCSEY
jgi:hypothetical protein